MKTLAFFNNKGGVGKTSLVHHLAWMLAGMGKRVIVADLDPQANVSSMFLGEEVLAEMWDEAYESRNTVDGNIAPQLEGEGGIKETPLMAEAPGSNIGLLVGDINLSQREDSISYHWTRCLSGDPSAFRITTALARTIANAGRDHEADFALVDVGPNLGAINRAALIASDYVIIPLAPDAFSLQGMKNVGPVLIKWREEWRQIKRKKPKTLSLQLPQGEMRPLGYVIMRHALRLDRPVKAYQNWIDKIPSEYRTSVLQEDAAKVPDFQQDEHMLAHLKDYRSLMPMAQEANKPMFMLKQADGVIGAQVQAVESCGADFKVLANNILAKLGE